MEQNWTRVSDPADPNRCQAVTGNGQCMIVAIEGTPYCAAHGGTHIIQKQKEAACRTYRLKKYQARLSEFAESDKVKCLRDEIGVLRILIEERMNLCQTDLDLMLNSGPLSDLIMKVEKLVTSCNKIEGQLGRLLDKTQVMQLATEFIEIVGRHIEDAEIVEAIADDLSERL